MQDHAPRWSAIMQGAHALDFMASKGYLGALLALYYHGEPADMATFTRITNLTPYMARRSRDFLAAGKLVKVTQEQRRGPVQPMRIKLTKRGRELAQHAARVDQWLAKHLKKRKR